MSDLLCVRYNRGLLHKSMVGRTLAHYHITAAIGAGGMGEVFRATDTRLDRAIALKVLSAETADDPERLARFQREARAIAALNHPHIVTIHSVEEAEGVHFLTMEMVEGEPLANLLGEGGLPVERLVSIGIALADALAAAHAKGIVHRDLKPANVMLTTDGRVKVLDFGLAKEIRATSATDATMTNAGHTRAGIVMGTPAYMSPEQIVGRDVDHRTDIFSLGVLLYETASGHRPFEGATSIELASAVLRDVPRRLEDLRPGLPPALAHLINRCLEKDRERRVQTARDVANELRQISSTAAPRPDEGFRVAVLPFKYAGGNADLSELAASLSEGIVTGMSRFSYLRVTDTPTAARYVIEGSIRHARTTIRVAVQVVDSTTGTHLWAETYDRQFDADRIFEMQDELIPRIVSTCADRFGVVPRSIGDAVRGLAPARLTPYEALMRGFGYHHRLTAADHAAARDALERAVEQAPANADCWAMLSWIYSHEHAHGFNPRPGSLDRALAAAQRAVETAPSNQLAFQALAVALFFRKETAACLAAAERALSLNPLDGSNEAAFLIAYTGDWERGCGLIRRAMELNPHHPRWYRVLLMMNEYQKGNYRGAVDETIKANIPDLFLTHALLAAAHAQLGEREAATRSLGAVLTQLPQFGSVARELLGKWSEPALVEHLIDGLRKAGLEVPRPHPQSSSAVQRTSASADSGAARAADGFWIAVLPFTCRAGDADLEGLSEGLSEDIITGLSRFSYLRVIARSATLRHGTDSRDAQAVGRALGARYLMEGSLRRTGSMIRVVVRLVDAGTGAQLWTETYNRASGGDDLLALQDDLVPRIVSTVADWYGVLPHSMSEAVRAKPPDQLSSYEAVLRSFGYFERIAPEEHAAVREALERAVDQGPGNADGWAMLSMMYGEEHRFGFNAREDPLRRALHAARRAVDAAHANHFAWLALAQALFFRKELDAFRDAAERAMTLNPMDGSTLEYLGHLIAFAGDWERGCDVAERARQLNPNHPGWYWAIHLLDAYRRSDYERARGYSMKSLMRGGTAQVFSMALHAAVCGQLGDRGAAAETVRGVLNVNPDFARTVRDEFGKWYAPALVEQLLDGLRKAGLAVPLPTPSGGSVASVRPSIAVLPFANLTADRNEDYFSDGLAEEIINLLAHVPGLKVIARTSAFAFRGQAHDIRRIADALGVTVVLEGSVRRAGSRIRVTAQLIDAADGAHVWSERFDRELTDVFALQDDLAAAIARAMRLTLSPKDAAGPRHVPTLAAHEALLKARHFHWQVTAESMEKAGQFYKQAIELDPHYAQAHVLYADYLFGRTTVGMSSLRESAPLARQLITRALDLDPSIADAYGVSCVLAATYDYDWAAAARAYAHIEADESLSPLFHHGCALFYLLGSGQREAAVVEGQRGFHKDPLHSTFRTMLANILGAAGRYDEAEDHLRQIIALTPEFFWSYYYLAEMSAARRQFEQAVTFAEAAYQRAPWDRATAGLYAGLLSRSHDPRADTILDELRRDKAPATSMGLAMYHTVRDEIDDAASSWERAIEERTSMALPTMQGAFGASLRASTHWPRLCTLINLPAPRP